MKKRGRSRQRALRNSCQVCGSSDTLKLYVIEGYPIFRCERCGMVFVSPLPSTRAIQRYYEKEFDYRSGFSKGIEIVKPQLPLLSLVEKLKPEKGSLLEIGSGAGFFLAEAEKRGWEVRGVEPSHLLARHSREQYGLRIVEESVERVRLGRKFDVIAMFEVLEHVRDPRVVIRKLFGALRKDGYLLLSVPNIGSLEARIFGRDYNMYSFPEHLYYFSPRTLRMLVETEGFEVVRLQTPPATGLLRAVVSYWFFSGGRWRESIKASREVSTSSDERIADLPLWRRLVRAILNAIDIPIVAVIGALGLGPMIDLVCRKR